ncbi:MAG: DUF484 family protein [Betaproteobacteria bacterium]|nr:DUF484 family protein [Betaproteobacteria bacterium]
MEEKDVAHYLKTHPQFFDRHPELLEAVYVPHPYGGRAISLAERQMVTLRDKAKMLEGKLGELIQFGEENDAISEKTHRLAVAIAGAPDFQALAQALYFNLHEDFAVPHVALRIWDRTVKSEGPETQAVSEAQRHAAFTLGAPQCGPAAGNPFAELFGEAAAHVRSLAIVPLGETRIFGILVLGSEDPQRFFPEMGTLYLRRIGELCAAALSARP